MKIVHALALAGLLGAGIAAPASAEVIRHTTPGSTFPILRASETTAGTTTVYLSGMVPKVKDESAPEGSVARFGDTETQTVSVFETIAATLADLGLTMGDVFKMQVFLTGPDGGPMDFDGFMKGYTQFFGTEAQPNLVSRSVMQAAGLVNPGWLVEIEVTAARP
ncbi:MAG: RidA family protein [Amaricoccus sp.]|uniref:RidA family protein n=1 Tax=Amaricoccus sp. TaxID=1872485 RepID=UPI0039E218B4